MVEPFAVVTLAGVVVSLPLAWLAWQSRPNPGSRPLVVLTLSIAVWNATVLAALLADNLFWSVVWSRLHFVGLTLGVPALFALVLEYGGRGELLTRRTVALLLVEPAVVNGLLWTNDYHGLFLEYVPATSPRAADATLAAFAKTGVVPVGLDVVFWLHALYTWGLAVVSLAVVVRWAVRRRALYRRQLSLLAVAIVVPLAASVLDHLITFSVRLTEPAFVVTSVLLTVAVVEFDFVDVTPIAHRTVLDRIGSAVLVLDDDDRVVEVNRAATDLLGVDESALGDPVATVLSSVPEVHDRYADVHEGEDTVTVDTDGGVRHLHVEVTPLTDDRETFLGRVFLIRDVTDRRQRQAELERQNEHLERFASLVSHDLRNPLEVARGHVELARETDDDADHLRKIADSHERMATIIDDVLALAREGQTIDERERLDLADLTATAWHTVDTGEATLDNRLSGTVEADRSRLLRAFENLFRNAVEHGDAATVTVGLLDEEGGTDRDRSGFYVADDGPGIPADDREQVFEAGYSRSRQGTGLGLSIVRSIVEAHGWDVSVTDADDGGARFEITGVGSLRPPADDAAVT